MSTPLSFENVLERLKLLSMKLSDQKLSRIITVVASATLLSVSSAEVITTR